MEERISFKVKMEITKIFGLVTLYSILLQATAYIADCKIPLFINGIDYVIPEMNVSSYENEIVQPSSKFEWGSFGKECSQMISLAAERTLKQPDIAERIPTKAHGSGTLNRQTRNNKIYANLRRSRNIESDRELRKNRQDKRSESTLNVRRQPERKENYRYLEMRYINSRLTNGNNRRQDERATTDHAELLSRRTSESSPSRRSNDSRNPTRDNRNIRRTKDEKAWNEPIRNQDRCEDLSRDTRQTNSYERNYFMRLMSVEQSPNRIGRYGRFRLKLITRENDRKQPRISFIRADQEKLNSEKPKWKHDRSTANLMVEGRKPKPQTELELSNKARWSERLTKLSNRYTKIQERKLTMERMKHSQLLGPLFPDTMISSDRRSTAQNKRSFVVRAYHTASLDEPQDTHTSVKLYRRLTRFTGRMEDTRYSDFRATNERHTKSSVQRSQERILSRDALQDRISFKRDLQISMKKSSNTIITKQFYKGHSRNVKQLDGNSLKTYNSLPSEIFIKGVEDSRRQMRLLQQNRYNRGSDRLTQSDKRRIINLGSRHEQRKYQRSSETQQAHSTERLLQSENVDNVKSLHLSIADRYGTSIWIKMSGRIQHPEFSRRFLSGRYNYLTLSRTLIRREADNRLLSETLHRAQYRDFSPIRHKDTSECSSGRTIHSRSAQRSLDSRHNDNYLEERTDEISNGGHKYRTARDVQHLGRTVVRNDDLITYRSRQFSQDMTRGREDRNSFHNERRQERISEISHNGRRYTTLYRKSSNSRKFYVNAEALISTSVVTGNNIAGRKSRESVSGKRESAIRLRTVPKLKVSRTEITITSTEERHNSKAFGVRDLPEMRRNINEDISQERLSLESRISIMPYHKSLGSENENLTGSLWNVITNIVNIFSKASYNTLGWNAVYTGNSLNGIEMKQPFSQDNERVESFQDNWKQSYCVKDAVIAGIGVFAVVRLQTIKTVD